MGLPVFSFTLSFDWLLAAESKGDRKFEADTPERPMLSSGVEDEGLRFSELSVCSEEFLLVSLDSNWLLRIQLVKTLYFDGECWLTLDGWKG